MVADPRDWTVSELVERCCQRPVDNTAWNEFVQRYHSTIKGSIIRAYRSKQFASYRDRFSEEQIEDLVQRAYQKLLEDHSGALKRYKGKYEHSIFQYLVIISINVVRDHFRELNAKKRPQTINPFNDPTDHPGDSSDRERPLKSLENVAADEPQKLFIIDDAVAYLRKHLRSKNLERDLLIFQLRYEEELTLDEISEAIGRQLTSIGIGSLLNRLIKRLRPVFGAKNLPEEEEEGEE